MSRLSRAAGVAALAAAAASAAACSDTLDVNNTNNPNRGSVFNLPRDVEALAASHYQNVHNATLNSLTSLYAQMLVLSFENASSLNNFAMGPRSGIPRAFIDNTPGNPFINENLRDFQRGQNTARTAATIFERINAEGFSLGTGAANDLRLRAFNWFGYGMALADVALAYDSAAVPAPGDGENTPPLVGYDSVMRVALRALDSAQALASGTAPAMSNVPSGWLAQSADVTPANFVRIIRAHKARFRANVARSLADREKVDWAAVAADASNGLTADFTLQLNPNGGYDYAWLVQHYATGSANWHQMSPYIIGMADTSGAYDAWLATPRDARAAFLIRTPDLRFPSGETRAAQNTNSPLTGSPPALYFRNRTSGEDQPGAAWAVSQYDFNRWRSLFLAQRVGPWPTFTKVENDMLAAEAYLRTGNVPAATALINVSRTRNGLPAIVAAAVTDQVPGGRACVPRVPDPAQGNAATTCGSVYEAMKWEKRMESAYTGYDVWYFDSRGWGDLPAGTPVHWPTPTQERDARRQASVSLGGVGRPGGAAPSTYGFGSGNQ